MTEILPGLRPALRDLVRFDRSKLRVATAAQNAAGVIIPFAVGAATGHLLPGLAAGIGALNTCFSDRPGPYRLRAGRMLLVSLLGALSALIGGAAGSIGWLSVTLLALWALGGGMLVLFGPAAEQIGLTSILLLLIYGGFGLSPRDAAIQAGFILLGGVLQTALSVVAWPFRQFGPERQALSLVLGRLADYTRAPTEPGTAPPITAEITAARATITGMGHAQSGAAESFRIVFDETERIRLELLALHHLRADLLDDHRAALIADGFDELWTTAGELLDRLSGTIASGDTVEGETALLQRAERSVIAMRRAVAEQRRDDPILREILAHADALLGQLHASAEIVQTGGVIEAAARTEGRDPGSLSVRLEEPLSILRANLTLRSASLRHALRLAVTIAVATALARQFGLERAYWVPLTVAIVLKPDFTSTFTRGVLRVAGTMIGLGLATLLVHLILGDVAARIVLIGVLTFLIRSVGPANFGVSAVAITGLVVVLLSFAGSSPESIIHYRGIDTLIGGLLSLTAYLVWPTWERARVSTVLADMLDAYRRYFDLIMTGYRDPSQLHRAELDRVRVESRLARSNAEASVERMRSEPAESEGELHLAQGILASSHRFVHSVMTIEATLYTATEPATTEGLDRYVGDVDVTLERLSSSLRRPRPDGTMPGDLEPLPDLRADQNALVAPASVPERMPILLETERITNSLNTMVDLVQRSAHPETSARDGYRDDRVRHSA